MTRLNGEYGKQAPDLVWHIPSQHQQSMSSKSIIVITNIQLLAIT